MPAQFAYGKRYNLKFYEENLDDQTDLIALSGTYKMVGTGRIPWGKDKIFEYLLFRNTEGKVVEVIINGTPYMSLMFCRGDKLVTANYSDYLEHGDETFPEFGGNEDICVYVDIKEEDE